MVPATGRRPDPSTLRDLIAGTGRPKTVTLIERVPLTPAGKPDKTALH